MDLKHSILILTASVLAVAGGPRTARASDALESSITRVTLRATVRLPAEAGAVTLGDLARIDGPQAQMLQGLAFDFAAPVAIGQWTSVGIDSVRARLLDDPTINDGSLVVTGCDAQVTRLAPPNETARTHNTRPAAAQPSGPILRDHVERWILARLGSTRDTTRIRFHENDAQLLSAPTAGRIVEIGELGRSERMSLRVVIYENERIVEDTTIRVDVQIQRPVRIAATQIRRNSKVSETTTTRETRWLAPTEPIADPDECLGQVAKNTVDPGSILLVSMLEPPVVIGRGQIVSARSVSGSVSVSMSVRALSDGVVGELIELESRDRKQRFVARVAAPGQVVIVDNPESSPR